MLLTVLACRHCNSLLFVLLAALLSGQIRAATVISAACLLAVQVTGSLSADVRTKGHRADHRIVEVALFFQKEVLGGGSGPLRPGSFPVLLLSGDNGQVSQLHDGKSLHSIPACLVQAQSVRVCYICAMYICICLWGFVASGIPRWHMALVSGPVMFACSDVSRASVFHFIFRCKQLAVTDCLQLEW
jgi:hypothetical protein